MDKLIKCVLFITLIYFYYLFQANKYERNKSSPTYKDLDFMEHHPEGILLEADTYKALMNTLERDCRVSLIAMKSFLINGVV